MPVPSGPARVALGRGPSERFGWGLPWGAPGRSGPSLGGLGAASGEGASGLFGKSFPTPEASMETDELRGLLTASWGLWRSKGQLELRPRSQRRSSTWDKGSDRAYGGPWALPWLKTCVGLQGRTWTGRSQRGREGPFIRSPGAYRGVVQGGGKEVAPQCAPELSVPRAPCLGEPEGRVAAYYPSQEGGFREVPVPHTSAGLQGFPLWLPDAEVPTFARVPSPAPFCAAPFPPRK